MKTSKLSAVTVVMLALFAAAGCDESSTDSLSGAGSSNRLPSRGAADEDQGNDGTAGKVTDPDQKGGGGSTATTTPTNPGGSHTGNSLAPGVNNPGGGGGAGTGGGAGGGGGSTVILNTFSKVWVDGETKGPDRAVGKLTGAGTMDSAFNWDQQAFNSDKSKVRLLTTYTRSDAQANGNGSFLQGGVAFATLTPTGVVNGKEIDLPRLNGDRTWMRPIAGFVSNNRALLMAASEDNGVNNNPQPVAYVVNTETGAILTQRGNNKPVNLIQLALQNNIQVQDPENQRGPHTIMLHPTMPDTYVVGMQYNNQAQEAYSVTVNPDNSLRMNWLVRYSNNAQHCRPQVAGTPGSDTIYVASVEANTQPADIGFRVSAVDATTGRVKNGLSKVVMRSQPNQNKFVSEPVMGMVDANTLGITWGYSQQVRQNNNGNGHAGGKKIDMAGLFKTADLSLIGTPATGVGTYGRHGSSFPTLYGPEGAQTPALAVISGSSTGTGGGFIQMFPLKTDGTLGAKDTQKTYQVSLFSDVANLQARGKRNPNNQARGFINGLGNVPNPGYTTDATQAKTNFMPEVKTFSFSTVTGYATPTAMGTGRRESVWLSLVPATWAPGISTTPGKPTETPGTNSDGTGPAPRSTAPGTNPSGEAGGNDSVIPGDATHPKSRDFGDASSGCAVSTHSSSTTSNFGLIGLAIAGVLVAIRRKKEMWS